MYWKLLKNSKYQQHDVLYVIIYVASLNNESISVEVRIYVIFKSYDVLELNSNSNCWITVIAWIFLQ